MLFVLTTIRTCQDVTLAVNIQHRCRVERAMQKSLSNRLVSASIDRMKHIRIHFLFETKDSLQSRTALSATAAILMSQNCSRNVVAVGRRITDACRLHIGRERTSLRLQF